MSLTERYIFRIAAVAFVACLVGLTTVIWITQALRELDLLTGKGQTIVVFLIVTALSLPALVTVIAPVALFIASVYTLNKLNSDSELIVMSAAGIAPRRLLRPFLALGIIVSILVGAMTIYLMPASFRELRNLVTKIRADFVSNIIKEGQFTTLDAGITFHYRERASGALLGIFLQDRREANRSVVYIAERGQTVELEDGQNYLVLESGSIQRQEPNSRDSSLVAFQRYAVDLSAFGPEDGAVIYRPRERTTYDLAFPAADDPVYLNQPGRFRAELHERFVAPLYVLSFVLIAFAALGKAETTRQGRGAAVATAVIAVVALRIGGFAASSAVARSPEALFALYGIPLLGAVLAVIVIAKGRGVEPIVATVMAPLTALQSLIARRLPMRNA